MVNKPGTAKYGLHYGCNKGDEEAVRLLLSEC